MGNASPPIAGSPAAPLTGACESDDVDELVFLRIEYRVLILDMCSLRNALMSTSFFRIEDSVRIMVFCGLRNVLTSTSCPRIEHSAHILEIWGLRNA